MAQQFNITAKLAVQGPVGIQGVVNSIQAQLGKITANINVRFNTSTITNVRNLNTQMNILNSNLKNVATNGARTVSIINQLGLAFQNAQGGAQAVASAIQLVQQATNAIGRNTNQARTAFEAFNQAIGQSAKKFLSFGIAAGIFASLFASIHSGISEFLTFQRELIRFQQVGGDTERTVRGISEEVSKLSTNFGVSSSDLIKTAVTLRQAGLSANETKIALEALAKTTLSPTFDNITKTTEGAIAVLAQFKLPAKELEGALGSINAVSAKFAVESSDLIEVIRRTGGAFRVAAGEQGIKAPVKSLNELLGLFTAIRATTRENAESISTGLRTIFARLERPDTIKKLKDEIGVDLQDINGQFIGALPAIKEINKALASVPTTDSKYSKVVEAIGGLREISRVVPLIQNVDLAERALNVGLEGQSTLAKDAASAQNILLVQLTKVKEEFLDLFRTIANDAVFQTFIQDILFLTTSLIKLAKTITPLIPLLTVFGIASSGRIVSGVYKAASNIKTGFLRHAQGGPVPGSGNQDTVQALLTPGEFVIRKTAAQKIGYDNLAKLNRYNSGGPVKLAKGRKITDDDINIDELKSESSLRFRQRLKANKSLTPEKLRKESKFKFDENFKVVPNNTVKLSKDLDTSPFVPNPNQIINSTLNRQPQKNRPTIRSDGGVSNLQNVDNSDFFRKDRATLTKTLNELTELYKKDIQALKPGIDAVEAETIARRKANKIILDKSAKFQVNTNDNFKIVGARAGTTGVLGNNTNNRILEQGAGSFRKAIPQSPNPTPVPKKPNFLNTPLTNPFSGVFGKARPLTEGQASRRQVARIAAEGAALLAPLATDKIFGTVENPGSFGASGARVGSAIGGGIQGAGVGAALGGTFGPLGAALGGLTGAIVGVITGLNDFDEKLKENKLKELSDDIGKLKINNKTGVLENPSKFKEIVGKRAEILREEASKTEDKTSTHSGINPLPLQNALGEENTKALLEKLIESQIKLNPEKSLNDILNSIGKVNTVQQNVSFKKERVPGPPGFLDAEGGGSTSPDVEVTKRIVETKNVEIEISKALSDQHRKELEIKRQVLSAEALLVNQIGASEKALSVFAQEIDDFSSKVNLAGQRFSDNIENSNSRVQNDALNGNLSGISAKQLGFNVSSVGKGDFNDFARTGGGFDQVQTNVREVLNDVLTKNNAKTDQGTINAELEDKIVGAFKKAGISDAIAKPAASGILGKIQHTEGESVSSRVKAGEAGKITDELLGSLKDFRDKIEKANQEFASILKTFTAANAHVIELGNKASQAQNVADQKGLDVAEFRNRQTPLNNTNSVLSKPDRGSRFFAPGAFGDTSQFPQAIKPRALVFPKRANLNPGASVPSGTIDKRNSGERAADIAREGREVLDRAKSANEKAGNGRDIEQLTPQQRIDKVRQEGLDVLNRAKAANANPNKAPIKPLALPKRNVGPRFRFDTAVTAEERAADREIGISQQRFDKEQNQFGVGPALSRDAKGIGLAIRSEQRNLAKLQKPVEGENAESKINREKNIQATQNRISNLDKALQNLATSTTEVVAAQNKLSIAENKLAGDKAAHKDIAKNLAFGSNQQNQEFARREQLVQGLTSGQTNLGQLSEQDRQAVGEQLDQTKDLQRKVFTPDRFGRANRGSFTSLSGEDISNALTGQVAQQAGLDLRGSTSLRANANTESNNVAALKARQAQAAQEEANLQKENTKSAQGSLDQNTQKLLSDLSAGLSNLRLDEFNTTGLVVADAMNNFNANSSVLADALKSFPSTLDITQNGKIEVVLNGAEILNGMLPQVRRIVADSVLQTINDKLPQLLRNQPA